MYPTDKARKVSALERAAGEDSDKSSPTRRRRGEEADQKGNKSPGKRSRSKPKSFLTVGAYDDDDDDDDDSADYPAYRRSGSRTPSRLSLDLRNQNALSSLSLRLAKSSPNSQGTDDINIKLKKGSSASSLESTKIKSKDKLSRKDKSKEKQNKSEKQKKKIAAKGSDSDSRIGERLTESITAVKKKGDSRKKLLKRRPALLEEVISMGGELFLMGNLVLISLNLSRNALGEDGLQALLAAVEFQSVVKSLDFPGKDPGLMRLCVHKNSGVRHDSPLLKKLEDHMKPKDPFFGKQ